MAQGFAIFIGYSHKNEGHAASRDLVASKKTGLSNR